jgi:SPP1 gp7 family putative phage head morphogenesis protein
MAQNNNYWASRFEILENSALEKGSKLYQELEKQYALAYNEIEKDIIKWYNRFVADNNVSFLEAKKILTAGELKEFKWSLDEYIDYASKNGTNILWKKQLQNASTRVHISRLDTLRIQIQNEMEKIYDKQLQGMTEVAGIIYEDNYYHTAYELQKGSNVAWKLEGLDNKAIAKVLSNPWTDSSTFSDKIWNNRQSLIETIKTGLTQNFIRGNSSDELIKNISKKFNTDLNKAGRLVMTESAFFAAEAQKDCFKDLGVQKYQILGTLDTSTCEECGDMDLQTFDMKDYEEGVTAPPFHPWCRCTTIPYFEDEFEFGERAARDTGGNTYYVPKNISYNEWKEKYVNNNTVEKQKFETQQKMQKNKFSDYNQYNKYKKVLGEKEIGKSFEEFQKMKYNEIDKYNDLKNYYQYKSNYPESNRKFYEINSNIKELIANDKVNSSIGTAVKPNNEDIKIGTINTHALNRMNTRNITSEIAQSYIDNAVIEFSQNTKSMYLSEEGVTVLLKEDKRLISTYSKKDFDDSIIKILEVMKNGE